jgi:hypothetical protein
MPEEDADRWRRLYSQLLDIERHWTEQVQNQQHRITTILTVNGFLLGFLAIAGFSESIVNTGPWSAGIFLASLAILAMAFAFGIISLGPRVPISGTTGASSSLKGWLRLLRPIRSQRAHAPALWLDPAEAMRLAESPSEAEAVRTMCSSLVETQRSANHPGVLFYRRTLMYRELLFVLIGLALLVVALVVFQFESSDSALPRA